MLHTDTSLCFHIHVTDKVLRTFSYISSVGKFLFLLSEMLLNTLNQMN